MVSGKYYYYDKRNKSIVEVIYTDNMIEQYEFRVVIGENKGHRGYGCGFITLINSGLIILGSLKVLKVLYV